MNPGEPPRAVVLLSGGLDSATALAMARADGLACHCLSFDYGQRHQSELQAARRVARAAGVADHRVATIDLRLFGGSALTGDLSVPVDRSPAEMDHGIPATYVPARNTIFLSFALAFAEVVEAGTIVIGVNAVDYSGYPDCRPEYLAAFATMAGLATRAGVQGDPVRIHAPLLAMSKAEIIGAGIELGVDYGLTTSCYDPTDDGACGHCDACTLRLAGFSAAGIPDPVRYR